MKRFLYISLLTVLFAASFDGKSLAETVSIETAEARIKAIVAYELNYLSLKDNLDAVDFNSQAKELETADNIDTILSAISDFGKNVKFTNAIKSVSEKLATKEELCAFYTHDVFEIADIKSMLDKRPQEAEKTKEAIQRAISTYLEGVEFEDGTEIQRSVNEDTIIPIEESKNTGGITATMHRTTINSDGSTDTSSYFIKQDSIGIISLIAAVLFAILSIVFFLKNRNLQSANKQLRTRIIDNDRYIQALISERDNYRREADKKNRDVKNLKDEIDSLEAALVCAKRKTEASTMVTSRVSTQPTVFVPTEVFVGSPRDGFFAGGSDSYRPGKSLFKINVKDSNSGDFEFVQRPEAIQIAQQSKSAFLEPACNIINDIGSFSQVTTVKNGKVERTDDGWRIISKADIHLA